MESAGLVDGKMRWLDGGAGASEEVADGEEDDRSGAAPRAVPILRGEPAV